MTDMPINRTGPPARSGVPASAAGLLALTALCALILLALPQLAAADGRAIEGTVTAPGAAEEVEVCVVEPLPSETCTYPEPGGHYLLSGLEPGPGYLIEFLPSYRSHYVAQYYKDRPSPKGAQRVPVGINANTAGIDAELELGGLIEGEATGTEGPAPLPGVEVCALNVTQIFTEAEATLAGCTHTDAVGGYRLPTLPPGTYKVVFSGAGESTAYLQLWDGGTSFSTATPIAVAAGSTTPGIDAQLPLGARIEGTVGAAGGGALEQIAVCALTPATGTAQRCAYTDPAGHYVLPGLPSGSYIVVFAPGLGELGAGSGEGGFLTQYYLGVPTLAQATSISLLAPAAAVGIDASLLRPALPAAPATSPPPASAPAPAPAAAGVPVSSHPLQCKKGFTRRRVKGRPRCVRVAAPKRRHHRSSAPRQHHHQPRPSGGR
jgi:Carboxypeptidase regulatory-like domain